MFTHIMDFMVLMPLGPQLMRLFEITPHQFSFLVSAYSFAAGICGLLGSLIFDRLDRKHALVGAFSGFLLGTLCCAFAPNFTFLLIARAISGAFGGVLNAICFSIVGDVFYIQERGSATGKLMTSFSLAAIVGVPAGLLVATHFSWHAPFIGIAALGSIILTFALKNIPNVKPQAPLHYLGIFSGISENILDSNSRKALITTFLMMLSQFVVIPFISPYLVSNVGFPEVDLPFVYLLGGTMTAISGPIMGKLSDRYGARRVFLKTGLLFLIPVFFITHLGKVQIPITLLVTTGFFIFSNSRMVPAMTLISSSIPPSRRGSFMSLNSCLQQLGSATASFVGGWVVTQNQGTLLMDGFASTAYLAAAFGICAYFIGQKIKLIS